MGREQAELTVWPFLFGTYVNSPSPPFGRLTSSPVSMSSVHPVWIKARLKERRRTTGFQIARPPLRLSCRLRPCDGCGHEPDECQGGSVKSPRESHDRVVAMLQTRIGSLEGQYIRNSHSHVRLRVLLPKVARSARHSSLPLALSFNYTSPIFFLST